MNCAGRGSKPATPRDTADLEVSATVLKINVLVNSLRLQ